MNTIITILCWIVMLVVIGAFLFGTHYLWAIHPFACGMLIGMATIVFVLWLFWFLWILKGKWWM